MAMNPKLALFEEFAIAARVLVELVSRVGEFDPEQETIAYCRGAWLKGFRNGRPRVSPLKANHGSGRHERG